MPTPIEFKPYDNPIQQKQTPPQDGQIHIFCATLNCGGQKPKSVDDIIPIFQIKEEHKTFSPDIYIIALQEIVKLNAKNCLIQDNERINMWRKLLEDALEIVNS